MESHILTRAVQLGFNNLKPQKPSLGFLVFLIYCVTINKDHIHILIVICEIHRFHPHFTWC